MMRSCTECFIPSLILWTRGWGRWQGSMEAWVLPTPPTRAGRPTPTTLALWPLRWPVLLPTTTFLKVIFPDSRLLTDWSLEQDSGDFTTRYATLLGALEAEEGEDVEEEELGPITTKHLLAWAWQVARGMEYLTSKKVAPKMNALWRNYFRSYTVTWLLVMCFSARGTLSRSVTLACPRFWREGEHTQKSRTPRCRSSGSPWRPSTIGKWNKKYSAFWMARVRHSPLNALTYDLKCKVSVQGGVNTIWRLVIRGAALGVLLTGQEVATKICLASFDCCTSSPYPGLEPGDDLCRALEAGLRSHTNEIDFLNALASLAFKLSLISKSYLFRFQLLQLLQSVQ